MQLSLPMSTLGVRGLWRPEIAVTAALSSNHFEMRSSTRWSGWRARNLNLTQMVVIGETGDCLVHGRGSTSISITEWELKVVALFKKHLNRGVAARAPLGDGWIAAGSIFSSASCGMDHVKFIL
jgi:hypothetical protein